MIYLSSKDIDDISEETLKSFLAKKYRENRSIDYKLKYEKHSVDEAKEEFLADVTGFANHYGGNIIIGVEELEEEGSSSQPGKLVGIEEGNKIAEMYRNLCDTSIDPPIHGLIIKEIFLQNSRWAVVIYVPLSLRKPHMVTFKGRNRFYIRRDDRTVKMTTDEVKRTVIEVISIETKLDDYIKMVEEEIVEDCLGNSFSLIMHSIPYLIEEDQVDTTSEGIRNSCMSNSLFINGINLRSGFSPMPNIHGIFGGSSRTDPFYQIYIHRTGYIGLAYNIEKELIFYHNKNQKLLSPDIRSIFLAFLNLCKIVTEQAQILSPYQIRCSFINSKGATYEYKENDFTRKSEISWKRNRLNLPGIRIDRFQEVKKIANLFFERLLNAFGLPYFI